MPNVFAERKKNLDLLIAFRKSNKKKNENVEYYKCPGCMADHTMEELDASLHLCPRCGHYFRMPAPARIKSIMDEGTVKEKFGYVKTGNPIDFPQYEEKIADAQTRTGLSDACVCATGKINGIKVICAALDSRFFMGSMGSSVGEKITLAAEYARVNEMPLIIFSASGGARMQEGIISLMQMAKTSAAIKRLSDSGGLFLSCITHPTTGGVTASFASLGDIIIAEPDAQFGFAGRRVIEQTIGEKLPEGFQSSEFQQEHGFVDAIVRRQDMRETISTMLELHKRM